jgi:hypothetical protein
VCTLTVLLSLSWVVSRSRSNLPRRLFWDSDSRDVMLVVSPLTPSSINESSCVEEKTLSLKHQIRQVCLGGGVGFLLKLNALANLPKKKFERLELSFDIT